MFKNLDELCEHTDKLYAKMVSIRLWQRHRSISINSNQYMSSNLRKRTVWHKHQRRLKSACASAQSDRNLFCPHEKTLHPWLSKMCQGKILIRLRKCAGWSESSLGAHVQRYVFWRSDTYLIFIIRMCILLLRIFDYTILVCCILWLFIFRLMDEMNLVTWFVYPYL